MATNYIIRDKESYLERKVLYGTLKKYLTHIQTSMTLPTLPNAILVHCKAHKANLAKSQFCYRTYYNNEIN